MIYSSLLFIYGFLPLSLLFFYITPKKMREFTLLLLSILFCGLQSLYYLLFISVYTVFNFILGHIIGKLRKREKIVAVPLALGIIIDLTSFFTFRTDYFSWIHKLIKVPNAFFPIGISFFTLSAIGTLIDIYKGRIRAEKSFLRFALYIMFFPKLIMGPLLRYGVYKKIMDNRHESLEGLGKGMTVFVRGLAKKIIIADNLYMLYNAVLFTGVDEISAITAWLGIIAYIFCLYFTLSGFADMGIGIAYCFGVRFPQSFNYPLFSTRIRRFAVRWQSQVVQWLRRYVTKPVYGICSKRWAMEAFFIFGWAIFGLWYDVSFNGIIWGIIIGTAVIVENHIIKDKILDITGIIYTFLVILLGAVFLSGGTVLFSLKYLFAMMGGNSSIIGSQGFYLFKSYIALLLVAVYASTNLFRNMMNRSQKSRLNSVVMTVSPFIVALTLLVCTALISYSGSSEMLMIEL